MSPMVNIKQKQATHIATDEREGHVPKILTDHQNITVYVVVGL